MSKHLAPVVVFAYKRKNELVEAISSLKSCRLADQTDLFIFSDGAKGEKDKEKVLQVREFIRSIIGFKSVTYFFSKNNKGLGNSIIQGVSKILESYPSVIVLEDDLVTSENFLEYMNQALDRYQGFSKVFSISGYNYPFRIKDQEKNDVFFLPRPCSYGWGTWKDRWIKIDWNIEDFDEVRKHRASIKKFEEAGSDIFNMLRRQQNGEIDSWAVRWAYNQYKSDTLTAYPTVSKIRNTGFSKESTNTDIYNKYASAFDCGHKDHFQFPTKIEVDPHYHRQLLAFYSMTNRIKNRLLTYLYRMNLIKNKT